jgi:hypothetical protein
VQIGVKSPKKISLIWNVGDRVHVGHPYYNSKEKFRNSLHFSHWVERTLDKLPSKGQGGSPLKYENCEVWKEKFVL